MFDNRSSIKETIKIIPGAVQFYQYLRKIRQANSRLKELSKLTNEYEKVVLHPFLGEDSPMKRTVAYDVIKDFYNVYGTFHTDKSVNSGKVMLQEPLGLLKIPLKHEEYLKTVGDKTRNMIRKAEKKGYEVKELNWNNHLNEIFEINTSKEERQGKMRGWYNEPVKPRYLIKEEQEFYKYFGVFKEDKLYAYLHLVLCGDFAFVRHFIGHAEHLSNGIMNLLVSWTVRQYMNHPNIKWIKYGTLPNKEHSMYFFRKHNGFKGFAIYLDLNNDQELLDLARKFELKPWWQCLNF